MSRAFELLAESLTEIIEDMEKTGGKNLTRKTLSVDLNNRKNICKDENCISCKKSLKPNR